MQYGLWLALGAVLLTASLVTAEEQSAVEPRRGFYLRLVDSDGQPVAGADVGIPLAFGDLKLRDTGWEYLTQHVVSDSEGICRFTADLECLRSFCLVANHQGRGIGAIQAFDHEAWTDGVTVELTPLYRVQGVIHSTDMASLGRQIPGISVQVLINGKQAIEYSVPGTQYDLELPEGVYDFEFQLVEPASHTLRKRIGVPTSVPGAVQAIDVPLLEVEKLVGLPAPELSDVVAWKNSEPLKLSQLRGKVVLLHFWGWWCGPCVGRMPHLMELHDKYADRGLVIIGIHIDGPDGEIGTVEALDEQLTEVREGLWKGRDLPFPNALVDWKKTPHAAQPAVGTIGSARSPVAAAYGVVGYPTDILIDPDGQVVGNFYRNLPEHQEKLEQLLSEVAESTTE